MYANVPLLLVPGAPAGAQHKLRRYLVSWLTGWDFRGGQEIAL
jgi:hypothetical protein